MAGTILYDWAQNFSKLLSADSTASSFVSKVPTTTEPATTTAGVLDLAQSTTNYQYKRLFLVPYGGNAENNTFKVRVIGWRLISTLWVPVVICQITCTLSAVTGIDGSAVENELFFCDTLVVATPASSTRVQVTSPATDGMADVIGHAVIDLEGFRKVEVTFDRNSSAAVCNALYAVL